MKFVSVLVATALVAALAKPFDRLVDEPAACSTCMKVADGIVSLNSSSISNKVAFAKKMCDHFGNSTEVQVCDFVANAYVKAVKVMGDLNITASPAVICQKMGFCRAEHPVYATLGGQQMDDSDLYNALQAGSDDDKQSKFLEMISIFLREMVPGFETLDLQQCMKETHGFEDALGDFASAFKKQDFVQATHSLNGAFASMSAAITDCNVSALQSKLDWLATALRNVEVVNNWWHAHYDVMLGSAEVYAELSQLATDIRNKALPSEIADDLSNIQKSWSTIASCDSYSYAGSAKLCHLVDGLFKAAVTSLDNVDACKAPLADAFQTFQSMAALAKARKFAPMQEALTDGLKDLSKAMDKCKVVGVGEWIDQQARELSNGTVHVDGAGVAHFMVNGIDVMETLSAAVEDLEGSDYNGFGQCMGALLARVQASGCRTGACAILIGLLESLEVGSENFAQCRGDVDGVFHQFANATALLQQKQYVRGLSSLADSMSALGVAVKDCDVAGKIAKVVNDTGLAMRERSVVQTLGKLTMALVSGADVTSDALNAVVDLSSGNYKGFGARMGSILDTVKATQCTGKVCHVVEGILATLQIVADDVQGCSKDLKSSMSHFNAAVSHFRAAEYALFAQELGQAIAQVHSGLRDCGAVELHDMFAHESNLLQLANVVTGATSQILIQGVDVFSNMSRAVACFDKADYNCFGNEVGVLLKGVDAWAEANGCPGNMCYVLEGFMQAFNLFEGSFQKCGAEVVDTTHEVEAAVKAFHDSSGWSYNQAKVQKGLYHLSNASLKLGHALEDCHAAKIAAILEKLVEKFAAPAQVAMVQEVFHVIVHGVDIYIDVAGATEAYKSQDFARFGYYLGQLAMSLGLTA